MQMAPTAGKHDEQIFVEKETYTSKKFTPFVGGERRLLWWLGSSKLKKIGPTGNHSPPNCFFRGRPRLSVDGFLALLTTMRFGFSFGGASSWTLTPLGPGRISYRERWYEDNTDTVKKHNGIPWYEMKENTRSKNLRDYQNTGSIAIIRRQLTETMAGEGEEQSIRSMKGDSKKAPISHWQSSPHNLRKGKTEL